MIDTYRKKLINSGKPLLLLLLVILVGCGNDIETNMSEKMVDFSFTTQDEKTLTLDDLKGEWWITNFMYTDCFTICPQTTVNLSRLQSEFKDDDYTPTIISFSVDPEHDTPEVLKDYAIEHQANLDSWHFLTGYDFDTIQNISENTFQAALEKGSSGLKAHGYKFYLVDPEGMIVKSYDGMKQDDVNELIKDVRHVQS